MKTPAREDLLPVWDKILDEIPRRFFPLHAAKRSNKYMARCARKCAIKKGKFIFINCRSSLHNPRVKHARRIFLLLSSKRVSCCIRRLFSPRWKAREFFCYRPAKPVATEILHRETRRVYATRDAFNLFLCRFPSLYSRNFLREHVINCLDKLLTKNRRARAHRWLLTGKHARARATTRMCRAHYSFQFFISTAEFFSSFRALCKVRLHRRY